MLMRLIMTVMIAVVVLTVVGSLPDIKRYIKMRQM